jgi:hypothetical protein
MLEKMEAPQQQQQQLDPLATLQFNIAAMESFHFIIYENIDESFKVALAKIILVASSVREDRLESVKLLTYMLSFYFHRSVVATISSDAFHWSSFTSAGFAAIKYDNLWYCFYVLTEEKSFKIWTYHPKYQNDHLKLC